MVWSYSIFFQEREIKGKKIDRLMQKKERLKENAKTAAEGGEEEGGGERPKVKVDEQIEQLRADIVFIQDNINAPMKYELFTIL